MCKICWEHYGEYSIVNEKTKMAAALARKVYEHTYSAGNLHNLIEDWNLEDKYLQSCRHHIENNTDKRSDDVLADESACLDAFEALTIEERCSAMAIFDCMVNT